jgi:hypothetical protein
MVWYPNSEGRYGANGAKGDLGESIVKEYCDNNSILFEDRNDINSQVKLKIDCLINGIPVDVKSNFFKGHLAVELWTRKNKPGWLYTTTAEEIYGVDIETKSIFRYNVNSMKQYVGINKNKAKKSKKGDVLMWVSTQTISIIEQIQ